MPEPSLLFADRKSSSGYQVPKATFTGEAETRFGSPEGYSFWLNAGTVSAGSTLEWTTDHDEEAIYVDGGKVEIDGKVVGEGGAVVIERDARATLTFLEDSSIAHFGQSDDAPPVPAEYSASGGGVHVYPHPTPHRGHTENFADGSCPTCKVVFFQVSDEVPHIGDVHSHSSDELIYVVKGALRVGKNRIETGMAIAVPADRLYSFRTSEPWKFINYRRTPSTATRGRKSRD
jgi:quercetin dioxygenase-like cupin family protein